MYVVVVDYPKTLDSLFIEAPNFVKQLPLFVYTKHSKQNQIGSNKSKMTNKSLFSQSVGALKVCFRNFLDLLDRIKKSKGEFCFIYSNQN